MSHNFRKVVGTEIAKESVKLANENMAQNGCKLARRPLDAGTMIVLVNYQLLTVVAFSLCRWAMQVTTSRWNVCRLRTSRSLFRAQHR
jgi:hypothetical protein